MTMKSPRAASEPSRVALGIMLAAWDEAVENGIPSELVAYAALFTALTDLVNEFGEDAVASLTRGLVRRIEAGEFSERQYAAPLQ